MPKNVYPRKLYFLFQKKTGITYAYCDCSYLKEKHEKLAIFKEICCMLPQRLTLCYYKTNGILKTRNISLSVEHMQYLRNEA